MVLFKAIIKSATLCSFAIDTVWSSIVWSLLVCSKPSETRFWFRHWWGDYCQETLMAICSTLAMNWHFLHRYIKNIFLAKKENVFKYLNSNFFYHCLLKKNYCNNCLLCFWLMSFLFFSFIIYFLSIWSEW